MLKIVNIKDKNFEEELYKVAYPETSVDESIKKTVEEIISEVKSKGDSALFSYTKKFDKFDVNKANVKVSLEEIEEAYKNCEKSIFNALANAYSRVKEYHIRQLPLDEKYTDKDGITLGWKWNPIQSVCLYVPGGKAFYPSSVIMNAVPAIVSGVNRLAIVTPANNGEINKLILVAARICGITEIYKIGGAQAIAAAAMGTETIVPFDKIVGPGNAYVTEAKRQVFGRVGIDMIAGPSEIMIIAGSKANPKWVATDLLSQAEHDENARSILVCNDTEFAGKVNREIEVIIEKLGRKDIALAAIKNNGYCFVVDNIDEDAALITNTVAPEHLEIMTDNPEQISKKIVNAGAIFLGHHTPEAFGDYIAGPSHVLPTYGTARFSSGLGVYDFIKRTSMIKASEEGLASLSADIIRIANEEKLEAHALSVKVRQN